MFYILVTFTIRFIGILFFRLKTHDIENVPDEGGYIIIGNHASNVDPPLLGSYVRRPLRYLAKSELFDYPVLRQVMYGCNAFPIKRGGADRAALRKCLNFVKQGEPVVLFPEGTRTYDGHLGVAKPGAAMIAAKAGVPVIPVYIDGAFEAWPRTRWYPLPHQINIYYGKPFDLPEHPEGMPIKGYYHLCGEEMMQRIRDLQPEYRKKILAESRKKKAEELKN